VIDGAVNPLKEPARLSRLKIQESAQETMRALVTKVIDTRDAGEEVLKEFTSLRKQTVYASREDILAEAVTYFHANDDYAGGKIDLCAKVDQFVEAYFAKASENEQGAKPRGSRVTTKAIKAEVERYIRQRSLPRDPDHQRLVDLRHEDLHLAYESGELEPTMLSFFLSFHTAARRSRLAVPLPESDSEDSCSQTDGSNLENEEDNDEFQEDSAEDSAANSE